MRSSHGFASGCLAFALASALLALPAFAQQGRWASSTPEQRAQKQTAMMKEKLALTADQVPKVEAINLDFAKKGQALFTGTEPKAQKMKAARDLQQAKEAALKEVLTPDQLARYQAARDELQHKFEQRARERRDGAAQQPTP